MGYGNIAKKTFHSNFVQGSDFRYLFQLSVIFVDDQFAGSRLGFKNHVYVEFYEILSSGLPHKSVHNK